MVKGARHRRVPLLIVVGLLGAFGPFGIDMYLPALPQLAQELGADDVAAQLTLVAYLVGLGMGQLFWGPLSDRIGRRAPILIGTAGFALASLACAIAPTIWFLVPIRLIQGLLGAAGVVVGRAVIRDLYEGDELARIFGRLSIVFGVAPVVAPVVGGALLTVMGWRGTFFVLLGIGVVLMVATLIWVPETLDPAHRLHGRDGGRSEAWRSLLRSPQFLRYAAVAVLSNIGFFAYINSISLVLQDEWRLDAAAFALWFAVNAAAGVVGGQLGANLVRRIAAQRLLPISITLTLAGGALVVLTSLLSGPFLLLEIGLVVAVFAFMSAAPLTIALCLSPFQRGAGTAAAGLGAAQFVLGSVPSVLTTLAFGASTLGMGVTILAASTIALALAVRRIRGGPAAEATPRG